jgi:glycosyltransferase involved in cell wall biosynthesis
MIEALCHGLPVVAVRSRAIEDLVKEGETGFIVEAGDAEALARAIRTLDDPASRLSMGIAAASWVANELSGRVVGERIRAAASSIASGADIRTAGIRK